MKTALCAAALFIALLLSSPGHAVDAPHLNSEYPCAQVQHFPDHVIITNACGVPIEVHYCFFSNDDFDAGDLDKTCTTEGVRTTGIIEPGQSVQGMNNITRPYSAQRGGESGLWTNFCDMTNRKATCRITGANPVLNAQGKNYRMLSAALSRKLENGGELQNTSTGASGSGKATRYKYYSGISTDGLVYGELATSRSEGVRLMEQSSGRSMADVMECGVGWYASWTLEVIDGGNTRYVGAVCNAQSKDQAIAAALKSCRKRGGSDCLRSTSSGISSRVMVSVDKLERADLEELPDPSQMQFGTYCHVLDGQADGNCSLRKELIANGVYIQ